MVKIKELYEYKIHCTPEQLKIALSLGMPKSLWANDIEYAYKTHKELIPSAEMVIGWLEDQEAINEVRVAQNSNERFSFLIYGKGYHNIIKTDLTSGYDSRRDATLAAIDAALDYLSNMKNNQID